MEVQKFIHPLFGEIRTMVMPDGQVGFVGKDVADVLGYARSADAVRQHVEDEDKGVFKMQTPGGMQSLVFVNESGLYSLILSSKLPQAREFKHWVTSEVLPQIRKTGGYIHTTPEMSNDEIMARGYMVAMATIEQKEKQLAEAQQTIEAQKPMVQFAEAITASQAAILIGDLAKLITQNGYKIGRTTLFKWLRDHGFLFKNETRPYQIWVEKGLFEISETLVQTHHGSKIKITTKVTPKGQRYFLEIFKKMIEK